MHASGFKNTLLKALDGETIARLRLQPVKFELKHEIEYPGNPIDRLYFLEEGMASMTTTFKDGSQVEVGMFGYESVIGVSSLMGAMFRHNLFRQCNPVDAMRNTVSSSDSPAGCSSVRTVRTSTRSRFLMSSWQTCLEAAVRLFPWQPGFSSEKDLSNIPAGKFTSSTFLGSRRPLASAI